MKGSGQGLEHEAQRSCAKSHILQYDPSKPFIVRHCSSFMKYLLATHPETEIVQRRGCEQKNGSHNLR